MKARRNKQSDAKHLMKTFEMTEKSRRSKRSRKSTAEESSRNSLEINEKITTQRLESITREARDEKARNRETKVRKQKTKTRESSSTK